MKFGSTSDSLPSHWQRYSTANAYRHVFFLWHVPSNMKLRGDKSLEDYFLKMLKGNTNSVSKENEVMYRYDEENNDMLPLYIKVILSI